MWYVWVMMQWYDTDEWWYHSYVSHPCNIPPTYHITDECGTCEWCDTYEWWYNDMIRMSAHITLMCHIHVISLIRIISHINVTHMSDVIRMSAVTMIWYVWVLTSLRYTGASWWGYAAPQQGHTYERVISHIQMNHVTHMTGWYPVHMIHRRIMMRVRGAAAGCKGDAKYSLLHLECHFFVLKSQSMI